MKTIHLLAFAFCLCLALATEAAAPKNTWDAATCADICNIVVDGGHNIDQVLIRGCNYKHENNLTTGDDGFLAMYIRNVRVDPYGNLVGLGNKGVSSVVMAHLSSGPCKIVIAFFSAANAEKFRNQAFELGFQKVKTSGKSTFYVLDNLVIEETSDKIGRFMSYQFAVQPLYMY